ncbi:hypothetical protein EJ04DRAFT_596723, partial [Polyplosphaeria fusca]
MRTPLAVISANRAPGGELSNATRVNIIDQRMEGQSIAEVATAVGCSVSAVKKTMRRWKEHNTIDSLPRPGRPK